MRKSLAAVVVVLALSGIGTMASAQTVRTEAINHPRIAAAIREMEQAIRYMEAAPHDFGGHKAAAIRATQAALVELRAATRVSGANGPLTIAPQSTSGRRSHEAAINHRPVGRRRHLRRGRVRANALDHPQLRSHEAGHGHACNEVNE
jgi:hypothetical protein